MYPPEREGLSTTAVVLRPIVPTRRTLVPFLPIGLRLMILIVLVLIVLILIVLILILILIILVLILIAILHVLYDLLFDFRVRR